MAIDILRLVDRLEELAEQGWRPPMGHKVLVDEEMLLNIIDQMRISIPKEIQEAAELLAQRDHFLAMAQEQARRMIVQAREEVERMLNEDAVRAQAQADAETMLTEAREYATRVIAEADRYAEEQLVGLKHTVDELQRVIEGGLETLAQRRALREAEEREALERLEAERRGGEEPASADVSEVEDELAGDATTGD